MLEERRAWVYTAILGLRCCCRKRYDVGLSSSAPNTMAEGKRQADRMQALGVVRIRAWKRTFVLGECKIGRLVEEG